MYECMNVKYECMDLDVYVDSMWSYVWRDLYS